MTDQDPSVSESGHHVPTYGSAPSKPGLYLALFHGRSNADATMDDWGFNGPLIGPLEWVHTTYATHVRMKFLSNEDELLYFSEPAFPDGQDIFITDDLIEYAGNFYGDWTVFVVNPDETRKPQDTFRSKTRRIVPYRIDVKRQASN
jgi:hypothetical protein